jgi:hypothetical protein
MKQMANGGIQSPQLTRLVIWAVVAVALIVPAVAMQFTSEVAWTASDFALAALLLGGAAVLYEAAARFTMNARARLAIGGTILAAVAIIWADGAVGIF